MPNLLLPYRAGRNVRLQNLAYSVGRQLIRLNVFVPVPGCG
jgi:hypothetical protein